MSDDRVEGGAIAREPSRSQMTFAAAVRWYSQSTLPLSVTQPLLTVTVIFSSGTVVFHFSADNTACAISVSVRNCPSRRRTLMSLATALAPYTPQRHALGGRLFPITLDVAAQRRRLPRRQCQPRRYLAPSPARSGHVPEVLCPSWVPPHSPVCLEVHGAARQRSCPYQDPSNQVPLGVRERVDAEFPHGGGEYSETRQVKLSKLNWLISSAPPHRSTEAVGTKSAVNPRWAASLSARVAPRSRCARAHMQRD